MKLLKQNLYFVFFVLFTLNFSAQNTETNDCDAKVEKAKLLLIGSDIIIKNEVEAIDLLLLCAKNNNPEAQYILGTLYKNGNLVDKDYDKAFKYINAAAIQNHPKAACELGVLYKDGMGCKLNFDTAINWFKTAHKLGDPKGAYSIGYLYFKGLGSVDQDYDKAIEWFLKSDYPMAKHWLGICYYFGYGVAQSKNYALELLLDNPYAKKSELLAFSLESNANNILNLEGNDLTASTQINSQSVNTVISSNPSNDTNDGIIELSKESLLGEWNGKLIELDWSGTKILRSVPSSFLFSKNESTNDLDYQYTIDTSSGNGLGIFLDDSYYFDKSSVSLPKIYQDSETKFELNYSILSVSDIEIKEIDNLRYFVANVETKITDWNEPGPPMLLVLGNSKALTNNGQQIDVTLIEKLASLKNDGFISLYPNPFKNDLLIQYDLAEDSVTSVEIFSFGSSFIQKIVENETQKAGKHIYKIDGRSYPEQGLYVVKITANNIVHTKLIVKE